MQAKVPQNVQIADKIVGPLTLKHMIILGVGGGLAYIIYIILARSYYWEVWLPPVAVISLITLLFAFVKIYNVSFGRFFLLLLEYSLLPRKRRWLKSSAEIFGFAPIAVATKKRKKKKTKKETAAKTIKKIDEISKILDNYGNTN